MAATEALAFFLKFGVPLLCVCFVVWALVSAGRNKANVKHLRKHADDQSKFEDDYEKFSSSPLRARLKRTRDRMLRKR